MQKSSNYSTEVKNLQNDLLTLGYSTGGADGYFGNNTYLAVKSFQRDYGLSADGIAGKQTLSKIDDIINKSKSQSTISGDSVSISGNLSEGISGSAVLDLQKALTNKGGTTGTTTGAGSGPLYNYEADLISQIKSINYNKFG